ncbi:MAG: ABC transporter permease [Williamsia herbipolensis]|nr:ABC transporter permease [Williamsia herbipolensis]
MIARASRSWLIAIPWGILAIGAAAIVGAASTATIGATDLGCSKTGTTGHDGFSCGDPITELVDWWPFVVMGLLLAGPPFVAAVVRRPWVSWVAVVVLAGAGVWGVGHWTSHWLTLVVGLALAILGAVVAIAHTLGLRASR